MMKAKSLVTVSHSPVGLSSSQAEKAIDRPESMAGRPLMLPRIMPAESLIDSKLGWSCAFMHDK